MDHEVMKIDMQETFKDCPVCDYGDGFHTMLKKEGVETKWLFICPACHCIFDLGFKVPK